MQRIFFTLAFSILFFHQLTRLLLSFPSFRSLELSQNYAHYIPVPKQGNVSNAFQLSYYTGLTNQDEYDLRKTEVLSSCTTDPVKSLAQLSPKELNVLLKHIIVSEKYKFLYCYTPKVACSNWKRIVKFLNGEIQSMDEKGMDHAHGIKYLLDYPRKEIEYKLKNYFKFMFVRNPVERLLSAYRNKFGEIQENMMHYGPKIIEKYRNSTYVEENYSGKIQGDDVSFEEFVQYLIDFESPASMNEHWAPQVTLCQPCLINYDFIGSYDHLYEDSEKILRHIGAPEGIHFPTRQSYYSPTTHSVTAYFYSLVRPNFIKKLFSKYSKDFTTLSFPFPHVVYPLRNVLHK